MLATDGLEPSQRAEKVLAAVMDPQKVEVTVLSVSTLEVLVPERSDVGGDPLEARRAHARELVDAAVGRLAQGGFQAEGVVTDGSAGHDIVEEATSRSSDIVVVGAGRTSWLGNLLLGSTSTHVLHAASCSVLVVHHPPGDEQAPPVLVGVDGSEGSDAAVEAALGCLKGGCPISVLSVVPPHRELLLPIPDRTSIRLGEDHLKEELERSLLEIATEAAKMAESRFGEAGFTVDSRVSEGHPTQSLLEEAKGKGAALVILGARGLGGKKKLVLGSVSDQVARHAPSTLVVR